MNRDPNFFRPANTHTDSARQIPTNQYARIY